MYVCHVCTAERTHELHMYSNCPGAGATARHHTLTHTHFSTPTRCSSATFFIHGCFVSLMFLTVVTTHSNASAMPLDVLPLPDIRLVVLPLAEI